MYGGETQMVQIECENKLINVVIDKFGEAVSIRKSDDEHFIVTSNVNISPTFYSWVFTFADKMKLISPIDVIYKFQEEIKMVYNIYLV